MTNTPDLYAGPITQIRDSPVLVRTLTALELGNEIVPEELLRDLFREQWMPTEATGGTPSIIVLDDENQADLEAADYVVIECGRISEKWEGFTHQFVDVETPILIHVYSDKNRQRVRNIMAEVRRILYKWILALVPYHSIDLTGITPEYIGPGSYELTMDVTLRQGALPAFERRVKYDWMPATDPTVPPIMELP